jgi:type I restriction enzyme M protein
MRIAATLPSSEDERLLFQQAIAESPVLAALAPGLLANTPPDKFLIAKRIETLSGLSEETAAHRAAMILKWREILLQPQLRLSFRENRTKGMWRRIEIRNFRSIEQAKVDLAPFTVVVGPNGSGKSNFIDAVVFARDVAFDASTAISNRGGIVGVRRWRPSKPTDVTVDVRASASKVGLDRAYVRHHFKIHSGRKGEWSFSNERIEVVENGVTVAHLTRKSNSITGKPLVPASPDVSSSAMVTARQLRQFSRVSALHNVRRYRLNTEAMRQPQISSEETRLRESGDNIAAAIRAIRSEGKIAKIVEPMTKIVPGLQDIYVDQVGRYLALKFRQAQEDENAVADFNATEMSEGALRALGIIVATRQMVRDELLLIEEPEVAVHVGAANLLFEILKEASSRGAVLLTTHSADLLDAARDEEILVCEHSSGSTQIGPLSSVQRQIVREGLFSVAELMRSEPLRIEPDSIGEESRESSRTARKAING